MTTPTTGGNKRPGAARVRWGRLQLLLIVVGGVAVLGVWWATATGRVSWPPPQPPLPL